MVFDSSAKLGRIISAQLWSASSIQPMTWTQVVDPAYAAHLWGLSIPLWPMDNANYYGHPNSPVMVDPAGHPGCVYVNLDKTQNAIIVVGVY